MKLSTTAERAIAAYGGIERWQQAERIEAVVSVKGLAFTLKRRPFFNRAKIEMAVHNPISRITPIGRRAEISGALNGDRVGLFGANGERLESREHARHQFSSPRRLVRWDDLDMSYFANYAFWNYFTLPALLMRAEIEWRELQPGLLQAEFPANIPTHSRVQQFRFDPESGRLLQHDYTADIISRLARAANVVTEHAESDGVCYPSQRRVTPRGFGGKPLGGPTLIDIELHSFRLIGPQPK